MPRVFMFPGQSSRDPGMVERAFALDHEVATAVFGEASEVLGRDVARRFRAPADTMFGTSWDIQLAVFLTTHVHLAALEARGVRADLSLGLSLGEYNHLVHIGALGLADAIRLVDERGRLYDAGPAGVMAAIYPITPDELAPLLDEGRALGPVDVAVAGSPTQTVIAGARAAVEHVAERASDELFAEHKVIEERVPMHVPMFAEVAHRFAPVLARAPWRRATKPYLPNVVGRHVPTNGPSTYVGPLCRHVSETVLWRDSIDFLFHEHQLFAEQEICVEHEPFAAREALSFVEVGPRQALTNLLTPRWHRAARFHTDDLEAPAAAFAGLVEELRRGS